MNKIIEILEKRQSKTKGVKGGGLFSWDIEDVEKLWEELCQLENGHFFEDDTNLIFYTTENKKIGFEDILEKFDDKRHFRTAKTSEEIIYLSCEYNITKSVINDGIFEITDEVGHYIKLRVEPMLKELPIEKKVYKSIRLTGDEISLLSIGYAKKLFSNPKKGDIYHENHYDRSSTFYFNLEHYSSLKTSIAIVMKKAKNSDIPKNPSFYDLGGMINQAQISNKENIEKLKLYIQLGITTDFVE